MQCFAAQVQITVLEADIFWVVWLAKHWQRQFSRFRLHGRFFHAHFDFTCVQVVIHELCVARQDFTFDCDDAFCAKALNHSKSWEVWIKDTLRQTVMVAQVDKHNSAMVSAAVKPA